MTRLLAILFICVWGAADAHSLPHNRSIQGEAIHRNLFDDLFGGVQRDDQRGLRECCKHRTHKHRPRRLSARAHPKQQTGRPLQSPERKPLSLSCMNTECHILTKEEVDELYGHFIYWRAQGKQ